MNEIERKARELLDLHADPIPVAVEDGRWFMVREQDALDAIVAALSQEVSHKAAALDEFLGLLRALTKVARLDEGESVWIEPSEAKAVIAVLATQQPQGVPEGWVLVPVAPTDDMLDKANDVKVGGHCYYCSQEYATYDEAAGVWTAMLAAAPSPERQ